MERFSQNLHSLSQVKYPTTPKEDDTQHDAKVKLRSLFNRLPIEDNDVPSVLHSSLLVIPCEQVSTLNQVFDCKTFSLFYIESVTVNLIALRFVCYYNIEGAVTPDIFLAVNLQPDDEVDVDRCRDLWFALSTVTNAVRTQWNTAKALRATRLQPPAPVAPVPMPQQSAMQGFTDAVRGAITASKNVSDKVISVMGYLQQSRGAFTSTSAMADVFFPLPTSILAPPAPVPNALVPVPQPPEPVELSEQLHPQRLKIDMAVPVLKLLLLGSDKFGFTHPLVGIKDSSILALVLFRLSSTKSTPYSADLGSDFYISPKNPAQLSELCDYITRFLCSAIFDREVGAAVRVFFDGVVHLARSESLFGTPEGIAALLHLANCKLGRLSDPTTAAHGPGQSLLFLEPPINGLGSLLSTALTIGESERNALATTMLAKAMMNQPVTRPPPQTPPPLPPTGWSSVDNGGQQPWGWVQSVHMT